jgi:hypothetical protein
VVVSAQRALAPLAEHLIAASAPHAAPPHLLQLLHGTLDDSQPPRGPGRPAQHGLRKFPSARCHGRLIWWRAHPLDV